MSIDYVDFNKACLKESSPFPNIDKLVRDTSQDTIKIDD